MEEEDLLLIGEEDLLLIGERFSLRFFGYSRTTFDIGSTYFRRMQEPQRNKVEGLIADSLDNPWDAAGGLLHPKLEIRIRMCVLMLCVNIAAKFETEMPHAKMIGTLLRILTRHSIVRSRIFGIELAVLEALEWRLWQKDNTSEPAKVAESHVAEKAFDCTRITEILAVC